MKLESLLRDIGCVAMALFVEILLWRWIIPACWHQGSSAAFEVSIVLMLVGIAVPFFAWFVIKPSKSVRK